MKRDDEKMEKTEERITHRMARDLEKADNKRKAEEEKKDLKEAEAEDMEEDRAKKRRQEEADHRTAASSGCQATVDVDSGIAPGGVAVDKRVDDDDEVTAERRGEKRKAEEEMDRDLDPGMDIDHLQDKNQPPEFRSKNYFYSEIPPRDFGGSGSKIVGF